MKAETLEKIKQELSDWSELADMPRELHGFALERLDKDIEDRYDIFSYWNEALHKSVTAYYHEETHEYKLRVKIGLIEFCNIACITEELPVFRAYIDACLGQYLHSLTVFDEKSLGTILRQKKVTSWEAASGLPEKLEGFSLFIRPQEPVKINNGSFIILDYVDFSIESSVTIYYNIYRDEFFGEARIWNIPDVSYEFDAAELDELESRLQSHLEERLREVRRRAEAQRKEAEK